MRGYFKRELRSQQSSIRSFNPVTLLSGFVPMHGDGCLQVNAESLSWWFYFKNGSLTYGTCLSNENYAYSLKSLSLRLKNVSPKGYFWLSSSFKKILESSYQYENSLQQFEYQLIVRLLDEKKINAQQAHQLMKQIAHEAIELFLLLVGGSVNVIDDSCDRLTLEQFNLQTAINQAQARLQGWKLHFPLIATPYQRPYVANKESFGQPNSWDVIPSHVKPKLLPVLQGHSLRQLASILRQDDFDIAKLLYPYIERKVIALAAPERPFDSLFGLDGAGSSADQEPEKIFAQPGSNLSGKPSHKNSHANIVCIDDSPNILRRLERFLEPKNFSVYKFTDPKKASLELRKIRPSLILLDLTMPSISGYEVCRMVRRLPGLEEVPIVIVTGRKGLVDKTRAKLVGATDYLEKPFTRDSLLEVVVRNLV